MTSTFDTTFGGTPMTNALNYFGEDVSYTPVGGTVRTIKAIVLREARGREMVGEMTNEFNVMPIMVSALSDTTGIISPKERKDSQLQTDAVVIDSHTWYVYRKEETVGGMHRLLLFDAGNV